jgi:hypothetical protein
MYLSSAFLVIGVHLSSAFLAIGVGLLCQIGYKLVLRHAGSIEVIGGQKMKIRFPLMQPYDAFNS